MSFSAAARSEPDVPHDLRGWMELALEEARRGAAEDEVPVGAVVLVGGEVVGRGHNRPIGAKDPTAHAEIVALREAAERVGAYRLPGSVLVATLEPCLMCCGAMVHARVGTLVYGAEDPKGGAAELLRSFPRLNHRVEVVAGVAAEECGRLLTEYFRTKRGNG
jgi:tRNA(adenine34) deaminase